MSTNDRSWPADAVSLPDAGVVISNHLAQQLPRVIRTAGDMWTYVVGEYDRLARKELNPLFLPIKIREIECSLVSGEMSAISPGLSYVRDQVTPALLEDLEEHVVELITANVYRQYCTSNFAAIQQVRLEFAVHFRAEFKALGLHDQVSQWGEVVQSLGGR